jgi:hypothetical protein
LFHDDRPSEAVSFFRRLSHDRDIELQ